MQEKPSVLLQSSRGCISATEGVYPAPRGEQSRSEEKQPTGPWESSLLEKLLKSHPAHLSGHLKEFILSHVFKSHVF